MLQWDHCGWKVRAVGPESKKQTAPAHPGRGREECELVRVGGCQGEGAQVGGLGNMIVVMEVVWVVWVIVARVSVQGEVWRCLVLRVKWASMGV